MRIPANTRPETDAASTNRVSPLLIPGPTRRSQDPRRPFLGPTIMYAPSWVILEI